MERCPTCGKPKFGSLTARIVSILPIFLFAIWFAIWKPDQILALAVIGIVLALTIALWVRLRPHAHVIVLLAIAALYAPTRVDAAETRGNSVYGWGDLGCVIRVSLRPNSHVVQYQYSNNEAT